MSLGADTSGAALYTSLTTGVDLADSDLTAAVFAVPGGTDSQLYLPVVKLTNDDLTTGQINGTGVFDALMTGVASVLKDEYEKGRITGADYAKAFIALTQAAMANAVQFLQARDASYWASVNGQIQAVTGKVQLEEAKLHYDVLRVQGMGEAANLALTKLKLASEDAAYATAKFNLDNLLPKQATGLDLENTGRTTANATAAYNLATTLPLQTAALTLQNTGLDLENTGRGTANATAAYTMQYMLPQQVALVTAQAAGEALKNRASQYNLDHILPQQNVLLGKQIILTEEQTEVQHAQTADTRITDGATVVGVLGKQKDLYSQQIRSYINDIEIKGAKLFTDAWITMKAIDEGLAAPTGFSNQSIDNVLLTLKGSIPLA